MHMNQKTAQAFSAAMRKAALDQNAKHFLLKNPALYNLLQSGAKRYVAGEDLQAALTKAKASVATGLSVSIEFMGEDVLNAAEANAATDEFLKIADAIHEHQLKSIISLDLSHIGLNIDPVLAASNLERLAKKAHSHGVELVISAEGVNKTDAVLKAYTESSAKYPNVGITLQAYLNRTPADLEHVLTNTKGKIRIVKGAFAAPPEQIIARGPALDKRYVELVEKVVKSGRRCSIASHDVTIHEAAKEMLQRNKIDKSLYEFEMLSGIQEELRGSRLAEGHTCREYILYGQEWYLYVCNRIAEHPENIFQFVIDIVNK